MRKDARRRGRPFLLRQQIFRRNPPACRKKRGQRKRRLQQRTESAAPVFFGLFLHFSAIFWFSRKITRIHLHLASICGMVYLSL